MQLLRSGQASVAEKVTAQVVPALAAQMQGMIQSAIAAAIGQASSPPSPHAAGGKAVARSRPQRSQFHRECIPQGVKAKRACVGRTGMAKHFSACITADALAEMDARDKHVLTQGGPMADNCAFLVEDNVTGGTAEAGARRNSPNQITHYHSAGHGALPRPLKQRGYTALVHTEPFSSAGRVLDQSRRHATHRSDAPSACTDVDVCATNYFTDTTALSPQKKRRLHTLRHPSTTFRTLMSSSRMTSPRATTSHAWRAGVTCVADPRGTAAPCCAPGCPSAPATSAG